MMKGGGNDVNDEYQSFPPPVISSLLNFECKRDADAGIRLTDRERENTCFTTSLLRGAKFRATLSTLYNVDPDPTE